MVILPARVDGYLHHDYLYHDFVPKDKFKDLLSDLDGKKLKGARIRLEHSDGPGGSKKKGEDYDAVNFPPIGGQSSMVSDSGLRVEQELTELSLVRASVQDQIYNQRFKFVHEIQVFKNYIPE